MAASDPGPPSPLAARSAIGNTTEDPARTPAKPRITVPSAAARPGGAAGCRLKQIEDELGRALFMRGRSGVASRSAAAPAPALGRVGAVWRRDQPDPAGAVFRGLIEADLARRPARKR